MKRPAACLLIALAATLAGACGGGSGDIGNSQSVVAPSPIAAAPAAPAPGSTQCPAPNAPANLAVTMSDTRVTLTWSAVSGAAEYIVLVGTSPSSSNEILTNTTNTAYEWNGARIGQHYARIQAKNSCGTSGSSNEVVFTVSSNTFGG